MVKLGGLAAYHSAGSIKYADKKRDASQASEVMHSSIYISPLGFHKSLVCCRSPWALGAPPGPCARSREGT